MTLIDFPTPKEPWIKPKLLEDWPWEKDLGKPYGEINGSIANPPEQEVNDLARYKDASPAAKILQEAADLIDGDRNKEHGDRHENFADIAAHWAIHLRSKLKPGETISSKDVCWMMVYLKGSRDQNGTASLDNGRDAAGYASLATEMPSDVGC
jgi:hypothetical protein